MVDDFFAGDLHRLLIVHLVQGQRHVRFKRAEAAPIRDLRLQNRHERVGIDQRDHLAQRVELGPRQRDHQGVILSMVVPTFDLQRRAPVLRSVVHSLRNRV